VEAATTRLPPTADNAELFLARGYHATSLREVAARLGITKPERRSPSGTRGVEREVTLPQPHNVTTEQAAIVTTS
jgi:hypothetical protein